MLETPELGAALQVGSHQREGQNPLPQLAALTAFDVAQDSMAFWAAGAHGWIVSSSTWILPHPREPPSPSQQGCS